jgi:hypothetical protein
MAVVEFYGKRRAREDLLDAAVHFKWRLFGILDGLRLGYARVVFFVTVTSSYIGCSFLSLFNVGGAG